ncbi:MAG: type III pantothenate kinase [Candidatus Goldiibacteriota bacterium]
MVIIFDVGNTNITIGVFEGEKILFDFRLKTNIGYTEDQYFTHIKALLAENDIDVKDITGGIIGSVVPAITGYFVSMFRKYFKKEPVLINEKTKINFRNRYKNKNEVGDDRLANAAAACRYYAGKDIIVVDFGTTINFDVIKGNGSYLGGVIIPGINMSLHSLSVKAAKLPQIEMKYPKKIVGNTTESSIQSGMLNGTIGAVNYIISGIKKELDLKKVKLIFTGGQMNKCILGKIREKDISEDRDFTLKGFKVIYGLNIK